MLHQYWDLKAQERDSVVDRVQVSVIPAAALARRAEYRTTVLLSNLDLEGLASDNTALFYLIQNRTEYARDWAGLDYSLIKFGFESGLLTRRYSETCYNVWDYSERYGEPLAWTEKLFHKERTLVGFPRAEILFESQNKLLAFLRRTVEELLSEGDCPEKPYTEWQGTPVTDFRPIIDGYSTKSSTEEPGLGQAANARYWSAPEFETDVGKIASCARKRQAIASDELLQLQNSMSSRDCADTE